jgi:tetratricopeptide (TPR) repeat protein
MTCIRLRLVAMSTALAFACVAAAPEFAAAVDTPNPTPPPAAPAAKGPPAAKAVKKGSFKKRSTKNRSFKKRARKPPQATEQSSPKPQQTAEQFLAGYRAAHALIYQKGDYVGGIAALKALGHDEHADVANLIGYASRKLGRYDDAKFWYEKALASDPNHARTWSSYGMWHAEQGNRLKAEDFLQKVASICGNTTCREYTELKSVIDGAGTY